MEQGFDFLEGPVRRVATLDTPIPFSPVLEKAALPSPEKVIAAVKEMIRLAVSCQLPVATDDATDN